MFEYIDKLRKGPEPAKRRFVLMVSIGITGTIALVWLTTLIFRINSGGLFTPDKTMAGESTKNIFKDSWNKLSEQINQLASSTGSLFKGTDEFRKDETTATSSVIMDNI